jgi:hypothetical protein
MRSAQTAIQWAAVIAAGIVAGLWMASIRYPCGLCTFTAPRFAAWESCLVGCALSVGLWGVVFALDREFVPSSIRGARHVSRFLFEELAERQTD